MSVTIAEVARSSFVAAVEQLAENDAALRSRPNDDEAVHHARVAVRRLRADLRSFRDILDAQWATAIRDRMRWLQDGFSAARDADVVLVRVESRIAELPEGERARASAVLVPLREARAAAYLRLHEMLHEPRYAQLLEALSGAARQPAFGEQAERAADEAFPEIVDGAWSTLRKRVRRRTRPPEDRELHAIRIAAKRARYAAEALEALGGRPLRRFARAVERLQTVLGEQHDATYAHERLRALARVSDAFIAGELAALEYRAACAARDAWRGAWREVKRAHRRLRR